VEGLWGVGILGGGIMGCRDYGWRNYGVWINKLILIEDFSDVRK